ncbi:MAG: hypothetical protein IJY08_03000 [Clostridia bacterium]|nr:hypothetical protein [Clostridia bacterium]
MKKASKIIWGIVLIAVGIVLGADILGFIDAGRYLFFDGWWTLFIIIPFAVTIFTKGPSAGNMIGLLVGVALLLGTRGIVSFDLMMKLIFPVIIVVLGLSMIFGGTLRKADRKIGAKMNELRRDGGENKEYAAVFSGQTLDFMGEKLDNLTLDSVFGGIKCDLRGAVIEKDVVINACAVFGGIDIIAPINVTVKTKSTSIFGGVTNHRPNDEQTDSPVIYINGTGIFGGVTIK